MAVRRRLTASTPRPVPASARRADGRARDDVEERVGLGQTFTYRKRAADPEAREPLAQPTNDAGLGPSSLPSTSPNARSSVASARDAADLGGARGSNSGQSNSASSRASAAAPAEPRIPSPARSRATSARDAAEPS
jgi:hypothetical protein